MRERAGGFRLSVAVATVVVFLIGAGVAKADSVMTPATRDRSGQGVDTSAFDGHWSFTVADIKGKPAQVIVRLYDRANDDYYFAGAAHPTAGDTFETHASVPPGVYELRAAVWGGPPHLDTSVTLTVDTP